MGINSDNQGSGSSFVPKSLDWESIRCASSAELDEVLREETHPPTLHKLATSAPWVPVSLFRKIELPKIQRDALEQLSVGSWPGDPIELFNSLRSYCLDETVARSLGVLREALSGPFLCFRFFWRDLSSEQVWRECVRSKVWWELRPELRGDLVNFLVGVMLRKSEPPNSTAKAAKRLITSLREMEERAKEDGLAAGTLYLFLAETVLRIEDISQGFVANVLNNLLSRGANSKPELLSHLLSIAVAERNEVGISILAPLVPEEDLPVVDGAGQGGGQDGRPRSLDGLIE